MARIELRDAVITIKDGLAGAATVNDATAPVATDTTLAIDSVSLNAAITNQVPIGARFTIAGETASAAVHKVTARTPTSGSTTEITFTPALGAGTYADGGMLTFAPQEVEIKVGDGDVTYTENNEYTYDLDRGDLDTVREGDQAPMDVSFDIIYEHITTGTGESISPMDALKRKGSASEWVSAATDKCEPYAVDIEVRHTPPCGTSQTEITIFPDFRSESREVSFSDSKISIKGRCNAVEPIVSRTA